MAYAVQFLVALILTLAVELAVLAALNRLVLARIGRAAAWRRLMAAGALGTAVTLPLIWFALPRLIRPGPAYVIIAEAGAVIIEAAILWRLAGVTGLQAAIMSLLANATSLLVGQAVL